MSTSSSHLQEPAWSGRAEALSLATPVTLGLSRASPRALTPLDAHGCHHQSEKKKQEAKLWASPQNAPFPEQEWDRKAAANPATWRPGPTLWGMCCLLMPIGPGSSLEGAGGGFLYMHPIAHAGGACQHCVPGLYRKGVPVYVTQGFCMFSRCANGWH